MNECEILALRPALTAERALATRRNENQKSRLRVAGRQLLEGWGNHIKEGKLISYPTPPRGKFDVITFMIKTSIVT